MRALWGIYVQGEGWATGWLDDEIAVWKSRKRAAIVAKRMFGKKHLRHLVYHVRRLGWCAPEDLRPKKEAGK